jgi:hypothetical protein
MLEQWFMHWYRRQFARWSLLERVRAGRVPAGTKPREIPGETPRATESRSVVRRVVRH